MKTTILFLTVTVCAGFASAQPLSTDELAACIKADYDSVKTEQSDFLRNDLHGYTHAPDPLNGYSRPAAAERAQGMAKDMAQRNAEVAQDNEATRAYYKKFADAEAAKWRPTKERGPDSIIRDNHGNVTERYDNL